jgi:hypothetical protein
MAYRTTFFALAATALLLGPPARLVGDSDGSPAPARPASDAKKHCCFSNAQYTGVCVVEPGEGETCASILDYLNNPQSQGKSYCGNTTIRGGWKKAECPKKTGAYQLWTVPSGLRATGRYARS